jgi:hypothetical protein
MRTRRMGLAVRRYCRFAAKTEGARVLVLRASADTIRLKIVNQVAPITPWPPEPRKTFAKDCCEPHLPFNLPGMA